jgi:predicted nucleic acid-binding protein
MGALARPTGGQEPLVCRYGVACRTTTSCDLARGGGLDGEERSAPLEARACSGQYSAWRVRSSKSSQKPAVVATTKITLDTAALVAIERRDRVMLAFMTAALGAGARITVPSPVVSEWWRGQHGPAARILDAVVIEPLSAGLARLVGETLGIVRGATLVDAVVVASAAKRGDLVLTSDGDDLTRIRDAAFPSVRIRRVG